MEEKTYTDWAGYYTAPKSLISIKTQKITLRYLVRLIHRYIPEKNLRIVECGGGNSCFATELSSLLNVEYYDIIDNCIPGIEKAADNHSIRNTWYADLTQEIEQRIVEENYNFVYSVGLVEHFAKKERGKVIENHFKLCAEGGYVLITAPTPVFQYKLLRKGMEFLHKWQFWDEVPMKAGKLAAEIEPFGEIVSVQINRLLPLSQCVIIARKSSFVI